MSDPSFSDLQFDTHRHDPMGIQATRYFPNGYGVSVVRSRYSYGGDQGLYELAVLAGAAGRSRIAYDTGITDDVLGHLTADDVTFAMRAVAALPSKVEA